MCRDLAPFFISQFLQSDAEKFWQETFFYRWIIKENEVSCLSYSALHL